MTIPNSPVAPSPSTLPGNFWKLPFHPAHLSKYPNLSQHHTTRIPRTKTGPSDPHPLLALLHKQTTDLSRLIMAANNNPRYLNDRLGQSPSGQPYDVRTGFPGILQDQFPTPPGVSDDFWKRLLNSADSYYYRRRRPGFYNQFQQDILKFRWAFHRLLERLHDASPTGNIKSQTIYQTRMNLPDEFFYWVRLHGAEINRTTWNFRSTPL
ncbi:hypothetical protein VM1G_03835 [Cytospora mali]|uniref:Uncharacterized protein n=1 Tax=Cytospora mali TaxID=578113 RepID=A0A194VWD7_CYTMA|nr:hypothetical protein VM1G_03835 [Valsa mali]